MQRASEGVQAVFHVGQPCAAGGSGHIEAASIVGNLDKQLIRILMQPHCGG
jgi:hypothetical protein